MLNNALIISSGRKKVSAYLSLAICLLFPCCSTLFAQHEAVFEQAYNARNPNLPDWVHMMYADNPNLKAVMAAYEAYYQEHDFEKNTYTQYYKRWIRDKWQYMNAAGDLRYPGPAEKAAHLQAYQALIAKKQARRSPLGTANWEELGPWEYDHEATMAESVQSPGSAHVYTVEQAASNPDIVYAGTANAGVWKSTDKGINWTLMTADLNIDDVYSLEIDHSNANVVYAYSNGTIWKTADGGMSWIASGNNQNFSWVRDLRMHPTNNQIILAATTDGLYRTTDAGASWALIIGGHFQEIEFHPNAPNTVYLIKQTANRTEFFKSIDGGLNFTLKPNGWPGIATTTNSGNFTASSFDGSTSASFSNVNLGSSAYPDFTIEMWVKSAGWSGDPALISNKNWGSGFNKGFVLAANGSGWKFNIGDGSSRIDLNGAAINDNLWHHIAVAYQANGDKKVYQDGNLLNTSSSNISTAVESGLNLAIAQDGTLGYGFTFPGDIAEVRIWRSALSDAEISSWACKRVDNTHPSYTNLLHLWKMDEGNGSSLNDAQGNNNGTISGTANWSSANTMNCVSSDLGSGEEQYRTEIAVSPAEPDHIYVLSTGIVNGGEGLFGFYKSTDAGENFSFTCCGTGPGGAADADNKNIVGYAYDLTSSGGQYYYDLALGVSPTNANKVMAAGISVVRSEDGGTNWATNGHWVTWVGDNTKQRYTHADVHDVKFFQHGNQVDMWVASDGGLYYSSDQGDNIEPRMHGIQGTEFWGFGGSYKEDAMIGGTYHNGTLIHYEDEFLKGKNGKGGWFAGGAGDATKGYVHDADGRIMFREGGMGRVVSRDNYWDWLPFDNSKNANMIRPGTYGNYEWDPYNYNIFYSPVDSVLWKTEDNGANWTMVHDFLTGRIYTIRIPVTDPNIIYVVHNDSPAGVVRLWKTTDGGSNWADITPSDALTGNNNYKNKIVEIDQDNPDNVWLLLTGGGSGHKVFQSSDGGASWTNITGNNLNTATTLDIVHHQGTDGGIYVGTNNAVYYRNNSHSDWQLYNEGLPFVTRCGYFQPYYTEGKIRVGTYRGAYQSDFYETAPPTARLAVDKTESGCHRDTFYFKDLSYVDHSNISWSWTFENGTPAASTEENPKVVFTEGSHDVSLTVTNEFGSQTMTLTDFITITSDCQPDTIPGNLLSVAGSNSSYAAAPHSEDLNFGADTDFTVTAWVKTTTTAVDATIIAKKDWDSGFNPGWVISTNNGKVWVNIGDGTQRADLIPNQLINDGAWHHLAVSFDRSDVLTIYIDGINIGTKTISNVGNINNNLQTVLGADSEYDYPLDGFIDELCIYSKALTQDEIRASRHLTKPASTPELVSYFQFNESSGRVLDRIGLNHLTLSSGAGRSTSSCPAGGGTSFSMDITNGGTKDFSGTGVSMAFPPSGTYPNGEVVVSRINLSPDYQPGPLQKDVYFVVNNYGINPAFSTLEHIRFGEMGSISAAEADLASGFELFRRGSNADGNSWGSLLDEAELVVPGADASITFSTDNGINSFSQFVIIRGTPLPVEWLSFNASIFEQKKVKLVWEVGTEINNEKYIVERSSNGVHFSPIGEVRAANLSEYQHIDPSPFSGSNYYRIKQVDFDGRYTYSVVRHILVDAPAYDVVVFPNPVASGTDIVIKSNFDEVYSIELFDAAGKLVQKEYIRKEGVLPTHHLASGVYTYRLISATRMTHGQIMVE